MGWSIRSIAKIGGALIGGAAGGLPGAIGGSLVGNYVGQQINGKSIGGDYQTLPEEITNTSLFRNLSREQQKDLLLNNPSIITPEGSQTYDPYTNSLKLNESDFTKAERLRQEGLASQLSSSLSGNFSNNGEAIQKATFDRGKALIDPIVQQQRRDLAQQLADQGIPMGSEGYTQAMNRLDDSIARQYTDLSQAAIQTSEQVRQQRFNEIATLLGRSQVQVGSSFQQYQPNYSGIDLVGAEQQQLNRQFQQSALSKQLSAQRTNAIIGGLGTLGGAGIMAAFSDIRLKDNIELVGMEKGFNIYYFNYTFDPFTKYKGVMAQEVQTIMPDAIIENENGYLMVDYGKIGIEMKEVL